MSKRQLDLDSFLNEEKKQPIHNSKSESKIQKEGQLKSNAKSSSSAIKGKSSPIHAEPSGSQAFSQTHSPPHSDPTDFDTYLLQLPQKVPVVLEDDFDKPLLLLDISYSGAKNKALAKLVDLDTFQTYYWYDTTGHKPYLITDLSINEIMDIPQISSSNEFLGIEEIELTDILREKTQKYRKIYGKTPLTIGGQNSKAFRNFIQNAHEADIRYHLNYICDRELTPSTLYKVTKDGLIPYHTAIDKTMESQFKSAFKDESKSEQALLHDYFPYLFAEFPDVLRCAFDIEVGSPEGVLPSSLNPKYPIISIALADNFNRKVVWLLENGTQKSLPEDFAIPGVFVRRFTDEASMLQEFFEVVTRYPIVLTYNGDNFDLPYLKARATSGHVGLRPDQVPIHVQRREASFDYGSIHLDLYQFFRQAAIRTYAFGGAYDRVNLDTIAHALLGKEKIKHEKWISELSYRKLLEYNIRDTEITLELTQFNNNIVMNLMWVLMRITKMPLYDFIRNTVSTWIRHWFIFELRKHQYLVPTKDEIIALKGGSSTQSIISGKKYQGAIVIEPQPGIWWDVNVVDFASLYPSIIKTRNLSFETIRCQHEQCKTNLVPETPHWVCKKNEGFISSLIGFVRDVRVKWFKPRSNDPAIPQRNRVNFKVIQSSLKVLINAGYGVLGAAHFAFYCPPVAESTSAYARYSITKTKDFAENVLHVKVLYGDTDSLFLYQPTEEQLKTIKAWSIKELLVELGTDYVFKYVALSDRKKNYFGITVDGKVIVKGLMGKKRNTPLLIRKGFDEILDLLKQPNTPEELNEAKKLVKKKVRAVLKKIDRKDFALEEISQTVTLSQNLKDYKAWNHSLQAIAQLLNDDDPNNDVYGEGATITYVPVKPFKITLKTSKLAFPKGTVKTCSVKPIELVRDKNELDMKKIRDIAESTFSQLLETIGMTWNEIEGHTTVDDWF